MNTCQVCPCEPLCRENGELCHPYLRTSFRTSTPAETAGEYCFQKPLPYNNYYVQDDGKRTFGTCGKTCTTDCMEGDHKHLRCVSHSCPLGTIVSCSPRRKDECVMEKKIVKTVDPCAHLRDGQVENGDSGLEDSYRKEDRPCCAVKTSWTEPRICRCDLSDPMDTSKRCACECGAAMVEEPKEKVKKKVRFDDQVEVCEPVDCDKAFRNLREEDVKELCSCCKECAVKGQDQSVGKPVLVYELPEPRFEGTSVTHNDFCWQKTPQIEVPPWHPNVKDRWRNLDVPSLAETTYQCDYKPPRVFHKEREPVYLAPRREKKIDPCQQLKDPCQYEECPTWKKTSTGPPHVYHSSCDTCDRDLHRVHVHECNVANLPPQFQCHGDGHICEPTYQTVNKFKLCEGGDTDKSRYWWKRTCGEPEGCQAMRICEVPPDLMKPACPNYTTNYKLDYKDPKKLERERSYFENCTACEYCTSEPRKDPPKCLCTEDRSQPLITQRAGVI